MASLDRGTGLPSVKNDTLHICKNLFEIDDVEYIEAW